MKAILGLTNDVSQALQKKDKEIVNAMALVKSCKEKLHWMRNNGFDALVEEVSSFCDKHHIDVPSMDEAFVLPGRSRRNAPIKTNRHHYRAELFIYVIDEQLTELDDRFNEGEVEVEDEDSDESDSDNDGHDVASMEQEDDMHDLIEEGCPQDPNGDAHKFYKWLEEAEQPLYTGCESYSNLSFVVNLMHIKGIGTMSN
ncbi:unnamed protein product [Prunus armeniaca]